VVGANLNRLVDLHEILYGYDDIEYLDYILFNHVASTILKWRRFKLLRLAQLLNQLVNLDEILCGDDNIEVDLGSILLNSVASTILKWSDV
jgi:hypothetical protein